MNKINLKEKMEILNMQRIIFAVVLFILLIVIASIFLSIWWPVKPSLAEITNSWVALIMVYLVLGVLLFEKPIYKFFEEFITAKKSRQNDSQQSRQEQFLGLVSDINIGDFASYYDSKQDNILNKEIQDTDSVVLREEEMAKYIRKLQKENIRWRFLFADTYLVLYAKYVLFWLHKSKSVNREEFDNIWQPKISHPEEREAILDALLDLEFIREEEGDTFSITELGSAYVNYLKEMDRQIG
jgi:ABC-type multidrug transport system fused ATPase/permease subunit